MFHGNSSELGMKNDDKSKSSKSKKVQFNNTVVAFINDGIDFWNYKCKTEPLHTKKQSKKYRESPRTLDVKHIKNKRKGKKK